MKKEFQTRLAEELEVLFPKGERCPKCGTKLPCRRRALMFNAYAVIYMRELLQKVVGCPITKVDEKD